MKIRAIINVDEEQLSNVSELSDLSVLGAVEQEFGWMQASGVTLISLEEIKEEA